MKPHDDGAMSFDEIGRRLGITGGGALMLYKSALRKLRRKRKMHELAQLVAAKDFSEINLRVSRGADNGISRSPLGAGRFHSTRRERGN